MSSRIQRLAQLVNRLLLFITGHWLAVANGFMALLLAGAGLAPWLMLQGHTRAGEILYTLYRPLCHQLPERSFFIGGERPWYSLGDLAARLGYEPPLRYVGNPHLGYKIAFCQRDVAVYGGFLVAGLAFALIRRHAHKPLPWQLLVASIVPMAIDGMLQLLGLLESTWVRRTATGLLFGCGVVAFVYPLLQQGMDEAREIARRIEEGKDASA